MRRAPKTKLQKLKDEITTQRVSKFLALKVIEITGIIIYINLSMWVGGLLDSYLWAGTVPKTPIIDTLIGGVIIFVAGYILYEWIKANWKWAGK